MRCGGLVLLWYRCSQLAAPSDSIVSRSRQGTHIDAAAQPRLDYVHFTQRWSHLLSMLSKFSVWHSARDPWKSASFTIHCDSVCPPIHTHAHIVYKPSCGCALEQMCTDGRMLLKQARVLYLQVSETQCVTKRRRGWACIGNPKQEQETIEGTHAKETPAYQRRPTTPHESQKVIYITLTRV